MAHAAKLIRLLLKADLNCAHTSGNCVRQITCDPLWGVSLDGTDDITGLVNSLKRQIVLNPAIETPPSKVKMCARAANTDRVLGQFNDIGVKLAAGGAFVTLGGGLGTAPSVGTRLVKLRANKLLC